MKEQDWQEDARLRWMEALPEGNSPDYTGNEALTDQDLDALEMAVSRMEDNYPYAHPLYAGQMLKPPHRVARMAYAFAQNINPNNHALDGGRASSAMEIEAVADIARMFGFPQHLGHLTGGGTLANMEALWVAGQEHPNKGVAASSAAHYTHSRITAVLKIPFTTIPITHDMVMDLDALERELKSGEIGTVVATAGTTGSGHVEPIADILALCQKYNARLHVDAAYGGYFTLTELPTDVRRHFDAIAQADSVVIDPHKHGLQPYGCGCVLFRDPAMGKHYLHDSPYTYFTSGDLHLGEISLECSRPGAAAVALWTTHKRFPLVQGGEMADGLQRCLGAAGKMYEALKNDERWLTPFKPSLDILLYAPSGTSTAEISSKSSRVFDEAAKRNLHLALYKVPSERLTHLYPSIQANSETTTVLRSTLMKWNHIDYVDAIVEILNDCL